MKKVLWKELVKHQDEMQQVNMRELFANDSERFNNFSIKFGDILFDYSKNIITKKTLELLINLAEEVKLKEKIEAMFSGEKINTTENRAVLHTALRIPKNAEKKIIVDGDDIVPKVQTILDKMEQFVNKVHSTQKYSDIVNIGIGGSDLGPAMVCQALDYYRVKGINSHFVSNVDGTDILTTLDKLNPETTLFIISSKTFTTQETMANAHTAKQWIEKNKKSVSEHFIALSTNIVACKEFGIKEENIFEFWDWVGGRYSLWSAIGMSIALSVGMNNFRELLAGGYEMDVHFQNANYTENIPVIMAILGIWYNNFFNWNSYCIVPYDHYLRRFPAFLQQLDMESNGKYTTKDGINVDYKTGTVIWGEAGTNAQHSFFQLIHQGTQPIPADFIAFINNVNADGEQHKILLSNFLAQTEALMRGKNEAEVIVELKNEEKDATEIKKITPHKIFTGNRPTNSILINKLTPRTLGSLIAMYEHKVFVQGVIWNVNSFDQWGVELGKQLAKKILPELTNNEKITSHDSSTNGLINYCKFNTKL